jgi:hypothetical protein
MTYSEPTPEQEIAGQESTEDSTQQETTESTEQDATEESGEPGKKQGDPLFAETEGGSAAGDESAAGTKPSS